MAQGARVIRLDFAEAVTNALVGLAVSWGVTFWILPWLFDLHPSAGASAGITALYFVVSLARAYIIRRAFRCAERRGLTKINRP